MMKWHPHNHHEECGGGGGNEWHLLKKVRRNELTDVRTEGAQANRRGHSAGVHDCWDEGRARGGQWLGLGSPDEAPPWLGVCVFL